MEKYLIYGYGTSGHSVENILMDQKISYDIYDDNLSVDGGVFVKNMTKRKIAKYSTIILSPGVSIFSKYIRYAKKIGVEVISEIEFAGRFITCPIIAVTGTDGKTTTVKLIESILKNVFKNVYCVGNIGVPLSSMYKKKCDVLVVEVSSFQLEAVKNFHPHIAVILNIASDHIDRHKTLENYIKVKHNIFLNLNNDDIAIYNADDNNITPPIIDKLVTFGKNADCRIIDNNIYYKNSMVSSVYNIPKTYFEDLLASVCVAKNMGVDNEIISTTIRNFTLSSHRLQFVRELNGVRYIDDSKSTSIHSTLGALKSFEGDQVTLILGGLNKKLNFDELFTKLPNCVKNIITFGKSASYIYKKSKKCKHIEQRMKCNSLLEAVSCAYTITTVGDVVLFSPACASFDNYDNYAKRGEHFVSLVNKYVKE